MEIQLDEGFQLLEEFSNLNKVSKLPPYTSIKTGKNIIVDMPGSGKTTTMLHDMLMELYDSMGNIKIVGCNTIEQVEEKYNECLKIRLEHIENNHISKTEAFDKVKIIHIKSSTELVRETIRPHFPDLYDLFRGKTRNKGKLQLRLFSLHSNSWTLLKNISCKDSLLSTNYDGSMDDLQRSIVQFYKRLKPDQKRNPTCKSHHILIADYEGNSDMKIVERFLDKLLSKRKNRSRKYRLVDEVQKELHKLKSKMKNCGISIMSPKEVNTTRNWIRITSERLKDIKNFDRQDTNLIVFMQNEKTLSEFKNFVDKKNIFSLILDEFPANKIKEVTFDKIKENMNNVLMKDPEEYTPMEYTVASLYNTKQLKSMRERVKLSGGNCSIEMPNNGIYHCSNRKNTYMIGDYTISVGPNLLFGLFKNITILTTERYPLAYCHLHNYKCILVDRTNDPIVKDNEVDITVLTDSAFDTTKKNTDKMKEYVKLLKKEYPDSLFIGKRNFGCDLTAEATKGLNSIYKNPKLKDICLFLTPPSPQEVFVASHEISDGQETPDNLMEILAMEKRRDDIVQVLGRVFGPRKLYRRSYGMKDVKVHIFLSGCDKLSKKALENCYYIDEDQIPWSYDNFNNEFLEAI